MKKMRDFANIFPLLTLTFIAFMGLKCESTAQEYEEVRKQMVEQQIESRGIESQKVLNAMKAVPRHKFVPFDMERFAYLDRPLPIGFDQTISQPYIVAFMSEQINPKPGMKVLEIGTGSGYQAAILAEIGCEVYTIELIPELAQSAEKVIKELNYDNVKVMAGNGYLGWPEHSPFDAIVVTAAPEEIPPKLVEQLAEGGIMIVPVGPVNSLQYLKLLEKKDGKIKTDKLMPVRFVPMIDRD
ncbi:protein-L-isoaspartate(D-aspartate) O-methyltransferase [Marinilabiliaceae bacterium ANBcel2]|nr:protein-L-isoaspartate(D-aspartate) O-methyltransferase [Marinilabiliaceae bacterium ANBcel2]